MGFLGNLGKLAMDLVETPIAAVKDVATLGGTLTDKKKSYTQKKLDDIGEDWDGMRDSLNDL